MSSTRRQFRFSVVAAFAVTFALAAMAGRAATVNFATQIRPILADKCGHCHGPDEATRQAELRLDQEESIVEAFAGGDLEASAAWQRIVSTDETERMPPVDSGKSLTDAEVALIRQWMSEGGKWAPHWAFSPPARPTPPATKDAPRIRHPIDAFVLARLEQKGLEFSPPASKEMLIRRVTFDLTGLPPTLEEVDAFLADDSPQAYERVVDRLLDSSRYGELMARDWLDGARYADTNGYQNDFERTMWPWRDWVIKAFNDNMPFDQFAVEQLAGDLLPNPTNSQRVATAFNRNHRTVTESGSIDEEWRVENVIDRAETTSAVFLGLTMGCARCHDHKYDPISQREFYQFYAFFNNVKEQGVYREEPGNTPPTLPILSDDKERRLAALDRELVAAEKTLAAAQAIANPVEEIRRWQRRELPGRQGAADSPALSVTPPETAVVAGGSFTGGSGRAPAKEPEAYLSFLGPAYRFNEAESLERGQQFSPDRDQAYSVAAWVKPRPVDDDKLHHGAIVSKMNDPGVYRGWDVVVQADRRVAVHMIHAWPDNALKVLTKTKLPHDAWAHLAVSYDGSSRASGVTIYFNGKPQPVEVEADRLSESVATDAPLRIGRRASQKLFRGEMAELHLFDRELVRGEVTSMMRTSLDAALEAFASFDDRQRRESQEFCATLVGTSSQRAAAQLATLEAKRAKLVEGAPTVMVMEELEQPRQAYLLQRGRYDAPDEDQPVEPNVPAFLPPLPSTDPPNRLTLARWITSPQNPLTARVTANRIWQRLFGRGLVKSSENFGVQAEPPAHPELLDWLATELVRGGWDLKQFQRMIVLSETYRQSSEATPAAYSSDPENLLLARGPRFRLPAEEVRDNALAISGVLVDEVGGPSVFPYQPAGLWDELAGGKPQKYVQSHGADLYRRSLYVYRKRTVAHPALNTFDAPSWEICQVKRPVTNTPLQALALLNDVTYAEAARKLGERMMLEGGKLPSERIEYGFRLATSRRPTAAEREVLTAGFERYLAKFQTDRQAAEQLLRVGEASARTRNVPAESAAYAAMGAVLLNLDEAVTKE